MVFQLSNLLIGDGGARIKDSGTSLSSVGGAYDFGNFSKNVDDASTTTVYNHNLGKVPIYIEFNFPYTSAGAGESIAVGYCKISNYTNYYLTGINGSSTTYSIIIGQQFGKITNATSTTFTIEWYKNNTGVGTKSIIYKLYA